MTVAFLKFFISRELESTMWHTKQPVDVTLVNKRHVDHDDIPSRLNIFTELVLSFATHLTAQLVFFTFIYWMMIYLLDSAIWRLKI